MISVELLAKHMAWANQEIFKEVKSQKHLSLANSWTNKYLNERAKYLKNRDIGILITDHNVRETLKIVDRAYVINDGRIIIKTPIIYLTQEVSSIELQKANRNLMQKVNELEIEVKKLEKKLL